jgi:hypothetical protein
MKKNLTYLVFVVDRSGSMETIAKDMIGGFNKFIKSQKDANVDGEVKVFFYQFDNFYEMVYENLDLTVVPELTDKTFVPRGGTALYCSLGKTIVEFGAKLAQMTEDERPEKVLVVTITDGEDNQVLQGDEKVYTSTDVATLVKEQTEKYSWDFAYIGANQNSWEVGSNMGYSKGTTLDYMADSGGTALMFENLSKSATTYRSSSVGTKFAFCPTEKE